MKNVISIIIFIVSFIASTVVVNKIYQLYMKLMGADGMFFSAKKKFIAIFIIWLIISGMILKLFGLA